MNDLTLNIKSSSIKVLIKDSNTRTVVKRPITQILHIAKTGPQGPAGQDAVLHGTLADRPDDPGHPAVYIANDTEEAFIFFTD